MQKNNWFRLPNEIISKLDIIGSRGLAIYCIIASKATLSDYPDIKELTNLVKCSPKKVAERLLILHQEGFLNDYDIRVILNDPEVEIEEKVF